MNDTMKATCTSIAARAFLWVLLASTALVNAFLTLSPSTTKQKSEIGNRIKNVCVSAAAEDDGFDLSSCSLEEKLYGIARRLKLEVMDLDEGIFAYDSQDNRFGLEVVHSTILDSDGEGLGIELTEVASAGDGRGLVLISNVFGAASKAVDCVLQVGDVLTGVSVEGTDKRYRLTALDYDRTVEDIGSAKQEAAKAAKDGRGNGAIRFEADRLVERATIKVEVVETRADGSSSIRSIDALAGENLRRLLQRKGIKIYNPKSKRFDMPYATGEVSKKDVL